MELQSGSIEIDGIDIQLVNIDLIRQRCFIAVSQDSLILLHETLRFNLDPDSSVSDSILSDLLTRVGLWLHFSNGGSTETTSATAGLEFQERSILDLKMSSLPELSTGQSQLFGLCRALVKACSLRDSGAKPVVLLDEVTSSLDLSTESTIHRIIDEEFTQKGHTVIIVTHRASILQEYMKTGRDSVALISDGRVLGVVEDLSSVTFKRLEQMGDG